MSILKTLFQWPYGIVVGNLIASAMWATPAFLHLHHKINRNHRQLTTSQQSGTINVTSASEGKENDRSPDSPAS